MFWKAEARLVAIGIHRFAMEEGPDVIDCESSNEEHGEELSGIYAPGCESSGQARIGRAGDVDTASGLGVDRFMSAMFK
jgi:hypothetical protein